MQQAKRKFRINKKQFQRIGKEIVKVRKGGAYIQIGKHNNFQKIGTEIFKEIQLHIT